MISHGKDIKLFTGNSNPALAKEICQLIGIKLGEAEVKSFADGEASVSLYETVRGSDVFLINSTCKPVNDSLMELLIMIDACKRASAGRVTAVIPYFGYARQDRKAKSRDPITAKLVANMITAAGADRVLTMDLHATQIQGFFDIPVDNLLGNPVFVDYYAKKFGTKCEDMVVVSPDVGSVARARAFAQKLHMGLAIVDKRRQKANQCEVMNVIGDVEGKDCIIFDDMIDTGGSMCNAAKAIVEVGGANNVYACASHGVLSGPALERLNNSVIKEVALLNTIPETQGAAGAATRSSISPWPPCSPRPSSAFIRKFPSQSCLTKILSKPEKKRWRKGDCVCSPSYFVHARRRQPCFWNGSGGVEWLLVAGQIPASMPPPGTIWAFMALDRLADKEKFRCNKPALQGLDRV